MSDCLNCTIVSHAIPTLIHVTVFMSQIQQSCLRIPPITSTRVLWVPICDDVRQVAAWPPLSMGMSGP